MTEGEKEMWQPLDGKDWPEQPVKKDTKDEAYRRIQKTAKEKNLDNLRLKKGTKVDLMGITAEVLRWGPRQHLVSLDHSKKLPGKAKKYGLMERTTHDTSWGIQDTLSTFQNYQSFGTLEEAEEAYDYSNK